MTEGFSALADLIGVPTVRPAPVNWASVEEKLGLSLPSDYKKFIDTYGPGTYGDLAITAPNAAGSWDLFALVERHHDRMRNDDRYTRNPVMRDVRVYPDDAGVIPWGETADDWTFCWVPADPSPERWGVCLINPTSLLTYLPNQSFTSFVRDFALQDDQVGLLLDRDPRPEGIRFVPAPSLSG